MTEFFEPEPPAMTLLELEENEPECYEVLIAILRSAAQHTYYSSPSCREMGLEMVLETYISLFEKGFVKLQWNEDADDDEPALFLATFNPLTGKYRVE